MRILLIALLLAAVSCANRPLRPVNIEAGDICAQCKMAVSETRYAAEISERDGSIVKFDNVDCMARYASMHDLKMQPAFVMDSEGREWLDARQALFVRAASIPGPMGSGVLALKEPSQAQDLAKRFSGRMIHFDDLWSAQ